MNPHRFCACYFAITKSFCLLAACAETRARECFVPPGALRGKTPEGKTEAHVPPGALRGKHRKRPPIQRCRALIVCVGTVCAGDQKSFRKGRAAPRARSQSARENGDHSEMMRCACGAVTVCLCVALATSHTLLQHLRLCGDSLSEDQKSFRSLSDAPPARAQSARGAADVSGVMRRASPRSNSAPSDPKYSALVSHFFK